MDASLSQNAARTNLGLPPTSQQRHEHALAALATAPRTPWGAIEQGEVKPLRCISALGERHAIVLERLGISDTASLWAEDASFIATVTGAGRQTADDWQCICELLAIRGIPDRHAAALVAAGVTSIEALGSESPVLLLDRIHRHPERHGDPSRRHEVLLSDVQDWIGAANRHKGWAAPFVPAAAAEV